MLGIRDFTKNCLYFEDTTERGERERGGPRTGWREGYFMDNSNCPTKLISESWFFLCRMMSQFDHMFWVGAKKSLWWNDWSDSNVYPYASGLYLCFLSLTMKNWFHLCQNKPPKNFNFFKLKKFNCHEVNPSFKGAFTLNVKSVLSENLGGILGGTQC
jgi:hypothetical protein